MTVEIEIEKKLPDELNVQLIADLVLAKTMELVDCPYEATVNLLLTDDPEIHEINKEMRQIDAATDVLSFPFLTYREPADFSDVESLPDAFEPDSGELLLGDVVISVDHILAQAEEYGHSVKREYAFLFTHSLLHLCGYDHMNENDADLMEEKQRAVMNALQIQRN